MAGPPLPRQQRRRIRRELAERGRKALARGVPQPATNDDALGLVLALHSVIEDAGPAERASRLADAAEGLLDRTMARDTKGLAYACRKGCGWCCWQRVICTAPEIFRVAEWMRANAGRPGVPSLDAIRAEPARGPDPAPGQQAPRRPCALLVDNACGIHPGRPLSCRAVLSMSAEACAKAMTDPATADPVPLVMTGMDAAEVVRTLMATVLTAMDRADAGYDLVEALAVILPDPTAEARWLAGEDVLAGVTTGPRPPAARQAQARLAAMLKELVEP